MPVYSLRGIPIPIVNSRPAEVIYINLSLGPFVSVRSASVELHQAPRAGARPLAFGRYTLPEYVCEAWSHLFRRVACELVWPTADC